VHFEPLALNVPFAMLQQAPSVHCFSAAAKHQQDAAEMFEAEGEHDAAVDCFKTAAEYYDMENSSSRANTCRLKVAQICADSGKYDDAWRFMSK